jgi:2,3-bisphosphoglycerate-dependent phosphoglycerate mutase
LNEIVLIRHGQSVWNKENLFTGWVDVDLSKQGVKEAVEAGQALNEHGYTFDTVYTSVLKRAIKTCNYVLEEIDELHHNVIHAWELNERHYGGLQGKNKKETAEKFGEEQLKLWRRSYDTLPPLCEDSDELYQAQVKKYQVIGLNDVPRAESLKTTVDRLVPYWENEIAPRVKAGEKIMITAHGNSLRALIKHIAGISDDEILGLEIPTGSPVVYKLDDNLKATDSFYIKDL